MLCGYSPFRSDDPAELVRESTECKIQFHERFWRNVSETAKDFIIKLVVPDPVKRLGAEEALEHPVRLCFLFYVYSHFGCADDIMPLVGVMGWDSG